MKQTTNENIKQIDITLGGGLISEKIRIDTINHPILIVGIGGTGIDALLRLKYQINRRFKLPDDSKNSSGKRKQKPDNIEFLAFETNEHDRKRYRGIGLDAGSELVLLSNASIGSILNNRTTIPDYITNWLSPELTITDGTKGASGNRQAGRLLLFEKINTVIDAIDNKMRTLRLDQENKLLVFILSGISGGTGGGSFLDIPYIIRGLVERDFGSKGVDKVDISGYLFTPDVHLSGNTLNIHTEEYIQRNGYASLKELDYWMNVEGRGERFNQKYGQRLEVNSPMAPFNLCHLVSATNVDGIFLKDAYDYCMNVTAENIVNFLAQEDKSTGQEFAIADYLSNLISNIATMESNLPPGISSSANFVYNIIGASAAVLPTEEITTYLAYSLFKEIAPIFDATPNDNDIDEFAVKARLDIDSVGNALSDMVGSIKLDYEGTDYYSYNNVIKTRRVNIDEKLEEIYKEAKRSLTEARKQLPNRLLEFIKTELTDVFLDSKKGPLYTSKLIAQGLMPRLSEYRKILQETALRLGDGLRGLELECVDRFEEARKAIIGGEKKKNAYIEIKVNLYRAKLQKDSLEELMDIYREVSTAIEVENDRIYNVYTEILNEINKILQKNAQNMDVTADKTYSWNVIKVSEITSQVDEAVATAGAENLIRDFAKTLIAESHKWISEHEPDIVGSLSNFIYDQFSQIISKSMEDYIKDTQLVIQNEIAPKLYKDALPVFHLDDSTYSFPSYGIVSVPNNAPEVLRGIEEYQRNSLSSLKFNIKRSSITNRIFWVNTQNGIPLFAYAPIRVYEELYEKTINTKEGIGRHLVMNDNENWTNLPSPIPQQVWGDTYTNARQKEINDRVSKAFELAQKYGVIVQENGRFKCRVTANFDDTPYNKYSTDTSVDMPTVSKTLQELKTLRENGLVVQEQYSKSFNNGEIDLVRAPKLLAIVEAENIKYTKLDNIIAKLEAVRDDKSLASRHAEDFLRILIGDVIIKKGALYVYNKDLEEDPWEPFVNLLDSPNYPEFTMFENYKNLPDNKKEIMLKKARAGGDENLLQTLEKWRDTFATRKGTIDDDKWNYANGDEMYEFYRNGLLKLKGHVEAIKD